MANWVRYPPPFSERSPLGEHAKWRCDTPPAKGVSQRYWRDTLWKQGKSVRYPPSAILSRKGIARYGGVSCTGPLSLPLFNLFFYLNLTSAHPAISNHGLETTVYKPLGFANQSALDRGQISTNDCKLSCGGAKGRSGPRGQESPKSHLRLCKQSLRPCNPPHVAPVQPACCSDFRRDLLRPLQIRKAPDTFNFLRHVMRAIWSGRPKCSHRCVSLTEPSFKPVQNPQGHNQKVSRANRDENEMV